MVVLFKLFFNILEAFQLDEIVGFCVVSFETDFLALNESLLPHTTVAGTYRGF